MGTLTQRFIAAGIDLNVETIAVYEYALEAFVFDPDLIIYEGSAYISISKKRAESFRPHLSGFNSMKWSSAISKLETMGFLIKRIHNDKPLYRIGEGARLFEKFTNQSPSDLFGTVPEEDKAKKKVKTEVTIEQRRKDFAFKVIQELDQYQKQSSIPFTNEDVKEFIKYWSAPLQNKPTKMMFEGQKTFVISMRFKTAWDMVYSKRK